MPEAESGVEIAFFSLYFDKSRWHFNEIGSACIGGHPQT